MTAVISFEMRSSKKAAQARYILKSFRTVPKLVVAKETVNEFFNLFNSILGYLNPLAFFLSFYTAILTTFNDLLKMTFVECYLK